LRPRLEIGAGRIWVGGFCGGKRTVFPVAGPAGEILRRILLPRSSEVIGRTADPEVKKKNEQALPGSRAFVRTRKI